MEFNFILTSTITYKSLLASSSTKKSCYEKELIREVKLLQFKPPPQHLKRYISPHPRNTWDSSPEACSLHPVAIAPQDGAHKNVVIWKVVSSCRHSLSGLYELLLRLELQRF